MPSETKEAPKDTKPTIRHKDGCPEKRVEQYDATRPDGTAVSLARCIECGEQTVIKEA